MFTQLEVDTYDLIVTNYVSALDDIIGLGESRILLFFLLPVMMRAETSK